MSNDSFDLPNSILYNDSFGFRLLTFAFCLLPFAFYFMLWGLGVGAGIIGVTFFV